MKSIRVKKVSSDSSIIVITAVGIPLSCKDGDDIVMSQFTICQTGSRQAEKLDSSGQAWISSILAETRYKMNTTVQKEEDGEKDPDFVDAKKATGLLEKFKEWKVVALERWDAEEKARNPEEKEAEQGDNGEDLTTTATITSNMTPKPSPSTRSSKDTNKSKEQDEKKKSKSKTVAIRRTAPMMRVGGPSKKKVKSRAISIHLDQQRSERRGYCIFFVNWLGGRNEEQRMIMHCDKARFVLLNWVIIDTVVVFLLL